MRCTFALSFVFLILLVFGVTGCNRNEAPAPVFVEKDKPATPEKLPIATPGAPTTKLELTPALGDVDPDRQVAQWAIAMGGTVVVDDGQKRENIGTIANLPKQNIRLRTVYLSQAANVTDESMKELKAVRLDHLDLSNLPITDVGLAHIADQTQLGSLGLKGTKITDKGLEHLKGMRNLNNLDLARTQVSGMGVEQLEGAPLTLVDLEGCPVTDESLKYFSKLPNLQALGLSDTRVSDKGLVYLQEMPKLRSLSLKGTAITDEGLRNLRTMANLATIRLQGTKVTEQGAAELAIALPKTKIER